MCLEKIHIKLHFSILQALLSKYWLVAHKLEYTVPKAVFAIQFALIIVLEQNLWFDFLECLSAQGCAQLFTFLQRHRIFHYNA